MTGDQTYRRADGGAIDRSRPLSFQFDGRRYRGYQGDTLAAALLANGVRLVGRSFKYHRPRGILSAGPEEPNALVELRGGARREPNSRATVAELFDGLEARSQNRFPSLSFDVLALNGLLAPLFAAGFYYKTFMWPAAFWEKLYEPLIRRAAGLGRASGLPDPDRYEKATAFCDLLVIGAGPAGLAAALVAGRSGLRVILAEQDFALGGRLLSDRRWIDGRPAIDWVAGVVDELGTMTDVRVLTRTSVIGAYDSGTYAAVERVADHLAEPPPFQPRQRLWRIVARRSVLAAGAIERPLVFGDNDRPGVMLAGAVRGYLNRFAVRPGARAVVFANNDEGARTVADLAAAGVAVAALVDPRPEAAAETRRIVEAAGARLLRGAQVVRARGGTRLTAVELAGVAPGSGIDPVIPCDLLAMSGGWNPTVQLTSHHGGKPVWDATIAGFVPGTVPPGMVVVGAAAGHFILADDLAQGAQAGAAAAQALGVTAAPVPGFSADPETAAILPLWRVPGARGKSFIDFQNDVAVSDVALAEREGFRAVEHLKRYTTLGMATDQGKTANVNGLAVMAELTARSISETGTTTARPPFTPTALGALAGHHRGPDFRPTRLTPGHDWAAEQGARFIEAGAWMRAQAFPQAGDADLQATIDREVLAVRQAVGLCDVTTLGKIDLQGPDVAEFLDRIYINGWKTLAVGRVRYGVMLREDGFVQDDGTTARLGPDHYLMTTTTANAGSVFRHLEFCHQVLWPDLDLRFISVTEQWAQYALAGPRARDVLAGIVDPGFDLDNAAFPHLAATETRVCDGVPARLFRISFSGELAYEIAVPARYGDALARRLMRQGADHGITPYGLEALNILRLEKGHVAGAELNGQTTARDLGFERMMSTRKDYIGRVMARRPALLAPDRPCLVGLRPVAATATLSGGAHLIARGAVANAAADQGHVTSVGASATLGHWIGLGLLANGRARWGEIVRAVDPLRGQDTEVEIVSPLFYDPEGKRLHA
ncbi:MAG: sarcosine oxidase subunit alpha family protein [Azospirillaceae bacterium]|nr:sarcosine oxidase subunit alpha family protein [Azospirillaceae bacterium]